MKGDFTRSTFKKKKHFNSVRMQQGRVQMDAEWNEQMDIISHLTETEVKDVIGESGVSKHGGGFAISVDTNNNDLIISPGRIYVDGILCELEEQATYTKQPDLINPPLNLAPGNYLVYLDVWKRNITALEDEYIREKALGGPDTTTRLKTLWQVKLKAVNESECSEVNPGWEQGSVQSTGKLMARAKPGETSNDPCVIPPNAGYRRLENQLYRVEIHTRGTEGSDNPTFKWSRNNGAIVAKVDSISGSDITISHPVPGLLDEFSAPQWIEVTDDARELKGEPGVFVQISQVEKNKLTVAPAVVPIDFPAENNPKIRLWNCAGEVAIEVPGTNDGYLELEDGVQIKFDPGMYYESGDFWLIPARSTTGDIEWPTDPNNVNLPLAKEAEGIEHHYCKLALVKILNSTFDSLIQDCREFFPPLNEVKISKGCCTLTVGDGKTSFGDVDSIQEAINQVKTGGTVCLLPGLHEANVKVEGGKNIMVRGCGKHSRIIPGSSARNLPIFTIMDSQYITLENMEMVTLGGTVVLVQETKEGETREIDICTNRIFAYECGIEIADGQKVSITGNKIRMLDKENGGVGVFIKAEESMIRGNDIGVVVAEYLTSPVITEAIGPGLFDTSEDVEVIYTNAQVLNWLMDHVWDFQLSKFPENGFLAAGGVQIASDSNQIKVCENRINGGYWNGITLGNIQKKFQTKLKNQMREYSFKTLPEDLSTEFKEKFGSLISHLVIEKNEIVNMGLNGIGLVGFFSLKNIGLLISINHLSICGNTIKNCLRFIPATIDDSIANEVGFGGISVGDCENLTVRENLIENNGAQAKIPVCGIFVQHGERIDISDNRILNNGPKRSKPTDKVATGIGGGIVIRWSFFSMLADFKKDMEIPYIDDVPAVKIHDNIVTQPLGKALLIMAMGPVSVVGNHLTSQGVDANIKPVPLLGASVLIFNLGVSRDFFATALVAILKAIFQTKTKQTMLMNASGYLAFQQMYKYDPCLIFGNTPATGTTKPEFVPTKPSKKNPIFELLLYLPTGQILFANNQTTLDLRSQGRDTVFCSQLFFTLDDISYVGNQSECNSLLDVVLSDVFSVGVTVRTNDNRFQEGFTITLFSLFSLAVWLNTCTGNQASHCLMAVGLKEDKQDNNMVLFGNFLSQISDNLNCDSLGMWLKGFLKKG